MYILIIHSNGLSMNFNYGRGDDFLYVLWKTEKYTVCYMWQYSTRNPTAVTGMQHSLRPPVPRGEEDQSICLICSPCILF